MRLQATAAIAVIAIASTAHGARLDNSFGTNARVIVSPGGGSAAAGAAVLQNDGKIVILATSPGTYSPSDDFMIFRLNADGSLDNSFDGDGIATVDFQGGEDRALAMAMQSDGKLIVAGSTGSASAVAARLNTDGSIDATFGTAGRVQLPLLSNFRMPMQARAVVIQADGRILLHASLDQYADTSVLMRLLPNGSVDPSYAPDGPLVDKYGSRMLLQPDGRLLVGGYYGGGFTFVNRYTDSGALDSSFGTNGQLLTTYGDSSTDLLPLFLLRNDAGDLTIGGVQLRYDFTDPGHLHVDALAMRASATGVLDTSFGNAGRALGYLGPREDMAFDGVVERNGKVVIGGGLARAADLVSPEDGSITRLNDDGTADPTFHAESRFVVPFDENGAEYSFHPLQLLRTPQGALYLIGTRGTEQPGAVLRRLALESQRIAVAKVIQTPEFAFTQTTAAVNESQTSATLTLTRTGMTDGPVQVTVRLETGSASTGDFNGATQVVSWQPGDADAKSVTIPITNDAQDEADEQFTVHLSEPSEGTIVSDRAVVTIVDDDGTSRSGSGGGGGGPLDLPALLLLASVLALQRRGRT